MITGASAGIGKELADIMAADGWDLVLVARRKEALKSMKDELSSKYGRKVFTFPIDLTKSGAAVNLNQLLKKNKLTVDALVNNAGFGSNGAFTDLPLKNELEMIDLNIRLLTELTHLLLPQLIASKNGILLNVASTAGFQPGPYMATYYASKAYVLHFTEAIAEETRKTGLKVSALCPGATKTEFFDVANMQNASLAKGKFSPMMSARKVAEIGYRGALKGKVVNISGIFNKMLATSVRVSPRFLVRKIAAFLNTKK